LLYQIAKNDSVEAANRILLISTTLSSSKFQSLFNNSLEIDKWAFIIRIQQILADEDCFDPKFIERFDKKRLSDILQKENPAFFPYLESIKKGNNGS
jgi:hypothetical protein